MTEVSPAFGERFYRPVVEIFAGIPSVVYGWVGHSVLAAALVLAVMIFPTITSVSADAIAAVPEECRNAAYGLGSTRWQAIWRVIVPAASSGVITGIILGLARAFGEALAVAMVIGQTTALLLFLISLLFITLIHYFSGNRKKEEGK